MTNFFRPYLQELQRLNLTLRQALEAAEAGIGPINDQIAQIAALGPDRDVLIEGRPILEQPYLVGPCDSALVYQAVLQVPGGIGVVTWDMHEYVERERLMGADNDVRILTARFTPFVQCSGVVKALLLPQARPLLDQLLRHLNGGG